jgi:hypothetical protein
MHLDEIVRLKVKVQTLETENKTLKSSCTSINITLIYLDEFVGQRTSNKSGLGYKKSPRLQISLNLKIMKSSNAKYFNKKHNYTF